MAQQVRPQLHDIYELHILSSPRRAYCFSAVEHFLESVTCMDFEPRTIYSEKELLAFRPLIKAMIIEDIYVNKYTVSLITPNEKGDQPAPCSGAEQWNM